MKNLVFILLSCLSFTASAQSTPKADSIYYLIDTAKVPIAARMWDIHEEYPDIKFYVIQCPCLQYEQQPTFVYNIDQNKGVTLDKKKLAATKLISLPNLILKAKEYTTVGFKGKYVVFIIEPLANKYIIHQVRLVKPVKPSGTMIDYENIPPPDPAKSKKP